MSDTPLDFFVAHGGCTEIALGVFVQFKGITDGGVELSVVKQPRHITRADIPESIVREIQAEALEAKGKEAHRAGSPLYMRHELDKSACIRAGNWLIIEAAKLREQKDGSV